MQINEPLPGDRSSSYRGKAQPHSSNRLESPVVLLAIVTSHQLLCVCVSKYLHLFQTDTSCLLTQLYVTCLMYINSLVRYFCWMQTLLMGEHPLVVYSGNCRRRSCTC